MKFLLHVFCLLITSSVVCAQSTLKVETLFDEDKNLTTVRMGPVRLAAERDRYHSLDFSLSYQYPGHTFSIPQRINFDLVSVVKARRLNTDLYVVFVADSKPIHFSSNRSAVRNPVPGRLWIGERMVFLIPYEDFKKIATAGKLSIRMGSIEFDFGDEARESLRTLLATLKEP
jgi:hypothetical protein